MALVGNVYIQASSSNPGAVGFGYEWYQTDTGDLYIRNTANDGWVLEGNADQTYIGNLSRQGGAMTGPITGSHGLMPLSGGNFTNAPTINNQAIATVDYVDTRDNYVMSQISAQVQTAIAAIPGVSIQSSVVIWTGLVGGTTPSSNLVIPITETYPDGSTISKADCQSFASIADANWLYNSGAALAFHLNRVDNMTWMAWTEAGSPGLHDVAANINYIAIAIKPGS